MPRFCGEFLGFGNSGIEWGMMVHAELVGAGSPTPSHVVEQRDFDELMLMDCLMDSCRGLMSTDVLQFGIIITRQPNT